MADSIFQSDLKIKIPIEAGEKATLTLNERGDLDYVSGQDKLSEQLMRAIVNDNSLLQSAMNTPVSNRNLKILFNLILRNFRESQITQVNRADSSFSGFAIYRLGTGGTNDYTKISSNSITYTYIDKQLINGTEYRYAFSKLYNGVFESDFVDKLSIRPQAISTKQDVIIGDEVVAISGDRQITFYVAYDPKYKASELLDGLVDLSVSQDDNDPRRYFVNITILDARGGKVSVAAIRQNPST